MTDLSRPTLVRAQAIVDPISFDDARRTRAIDFSSSNVIGHIWPKSSPLHWWSVTVWGQPPHDVERRYLLALGNASLAAEEGIRRFVAEMEARPPALIL